MEQYEFSDNCKVKIVLLLARLCQVRVKLFLSAMRLWHKLKNNALTQGFVERVELLLVSL